MTSNPGEVLTVTVVDASPYGPEGKNDCNDDLDRTDAGICTLGGACTSNADCSGSGDWCLGADDDDCDDDGVPDLEVRLFSEGEPRGERVVLDRVGATATHQGTIAVSSTLDVSGVLFVRRNGTSAPVVRAQYEDRDDGAGGSCGALESTASFSLPAGSILVKGYALSDNGDGDQFPDTNETVAMAITAINKTGMPLTGVTARLSTQSPDIVCISDNTILVGDMAAGETVTSADTFTFRVGPVTRTNVTDDLSATIQITFQAAEVGLVDVPQELVLDLDLNLSGGLFPFNYAESFEAANFGAFTTQTLDANRASNVLSDGLRCQYTDPDAPGSNTSGDGSCFLGFTNGVDNGYDWHVHTTAAPDGGRSYLGSRSVHFGVHGAAPGDDTTRLSQLDAIRMTNPVNLGWNNVMPELSFKHQVSFVDDRIFPVPAGESLDRGVVQVQFANATGIAVGSWRTLDPYSNVYDSQGTAVDLDRCLFDPADDASGEDDYFSDRDLNRRLGPSSTCYAEHAFAFQGDTSTLPFDPARIGRASDGPGLAGSLGPGTWVESKFNLQRYRGRRIRLRFVATTAEHDEALTHAVDTPSVPFDDVADDGWYIDDVRITNTLSSAATVAIDTRANSGLPACPAAACTTVTAALVSSPPALPAPTGSVTLSAGGSSADACVDGTLQYQFWKDTDQNGVLGSGPDVLLRDYTDLSTLATSVSGTTQYGVRVRCTSAPQTCLDEAVVLVTAATCADGQIVRLQGSNGTQNVGEFVRFGVAGIAPVAYQWSVAGPVLRDYQESTRARWATSPMAPANLQQGTVSFYWKPMPSQIHPLNGGPVNRSVSVTATLQDGSTCGYAMNVPVERNGNDPIRQAVDFFASNHAAGTCGTCSDSPAACARIVREYEAWWWRWHPGFYDGALFFDLHHQFLERYARWRTEFGYGPTGVWDAGIPIPNDPDINHMCRFTGYRPVPRPPYFSTCGNSGVLRPFNGMTCDVSHGGELGLASFPPDQRLLGCAVSFPYRFHAMFGSTLSGPFAPKDGLFFRLHAFLDQISLARSQCTPPRINYQIPFRLFPYVTAYPPTTEIDFDQPVTGVAPGDLRVAGSLATAVSGEGAGPYVFSGYAPPAPGAVSVEVLPGVIEDEENEPFPGATWSLTLVDPFSDTDGDGLSNADEIDLYLTDPTNADSDGDGVDDGTEVGTGANPLDDQSPCQGPAFDGVLTVSNSPSTTLSWTAGSAQAFDVLRGDLGILIGDCDHDGEPGDCLGGSFSYALNAVPAGTDVCLANDTTALSVDDPAVDPGPGNGWFYLLRAVAACGSGGTFDDPGVAATRDPGIATATTHCP